MRPQVLDFIPGLLEYKDKYIQNANGHYLVAKQKGEVQIKMWDDNGNTFIAILHNVLLAPDLCNKLSSIIRLFNSVNTCLFYKSFCTLYFINKKKNAVTVTYSAQKKHAFWVKTKEMSKSNKIAPVNKLALETLHHRLGHISTK